MRAVVQRVTRAKVTVDDKLVGEIGKGLVVLLGIARDDTKLDAAYLAEKICALRIFDDEEGKMNLSLKDANGGVLIVSQFTLYGDTTGGNRPSYSEAAKPEIAKPLYERFIQYCKEQGVSVQSGVFQAHMDVFLVNDGPVTLMCHSEN